MQINNNSNGHLQQKYLNNSPWSFVVIEYEGDTTTIFLAQPFYTFKHK